MENNKCIKNCFFDEIFKYEYENVCYRDCPIGTSPLKKKSIFMRKIKIICPEIALMRIPKLIYAKRNAILKICSQNNVELVIQK